MRFNDHVAVLESIAALCRLARAPIFAISLLHFGVVVASRAATVADAEALFNSGKYEECIGVAVAEFERGVWNDRWPQFAVRGYLTLGRYDQALEFYERAKRRFSASLGLRMLGRDVYRYTKSPKEADDESKSVLGMIRSGQWRFTSAADLVTIGRYLLDQGVDAKHVLENYYDRVRNANPKLAEVYIASAELALQKHDNQLAAQMLDTAVKLEPSNPAVFYLLARAYQSSDSERATESLRTALSLNSRHVPSLLLQVDQLIDQERYAAADQVLADVLSVNLYQPEAWAYHAAIAHLQGHFRGEELLRAAGLMQWPNNHIVDHLIGTKLSQKYRFHEGQAYQRRAIEKNRKFLPARFQLAQDLLRLGEDVEGWQLAHDVQAEDAFNVVAYNLVTLHDTLSKFATIEDENFVVRMNAREAKLYGDSVLRLLNEARASLNPKYDVELGERVTVEIFPQQQDFAIRTFGLPGGSGYLGVCFGRLITANSPASQGNTPSNWKSVLWHEYCHVVTLEKTRNRMPRWLSEGISVYEERQRDTSWGEQLTPAYRKMILGGEWVPVAQLSSAFLDPKSPLHLQFAYYESSLVVECIVEQFGFDTLLRVLNDLSIGMPINETLGRYTGSMKLFEQQAEQYARRKAENLAPGIDFSEQEMPPDRQEVGEFAVKHSTNYNVLRAAADFLIEQQRWSEAKQPLEHLFRLFPNDATAGNAASRLAHVHRELGETDDERRMLEHWSSIDPDAAPAYARLLQIYASDGNWPKVYEQAQRLLAVQPHQPLGHEMLAAAGRELGKTDERVHALEALLEFEPADPALAHFSLAEALQQAGQADRAKRHTLMALEHAPRYRDAHRLLLELVGQEGSPGESK
jgi:tetratricopeptide (TPR) repeat protein